MRRQAIVTAVDASGKRIEAVALLSDVCVSCTQDCGRVGKPFLIENPAKLPVTVGSVVRVYHSRLVRGISGVIALFLPILCALVCYRYAPFFAKKLELELTELVKALCVLAGVLVPGGAIFIVNRSNLHIFKPVITQVL